MSAHTQVAWHGTPRDYVKGFLISVVLTAVPFWLVMGGMVENKHTAALLIMGLAAAQVVTHVVFFLHVSANSESGWTLVSLMFTLILVAIMLAGSLWIMNHLDSNMMPSHEMSVLS